MEEILGSHIDDAAFARFLADWQAILADRTWQATEAIAAVAGVHGLLLAGSNGAGRPWPLSDIDFIPVYEDAFIDSAIAAVDEVRRSLLEQWRYQGWRTGVDVGRLYFTRGELNRFFSAQALEIVSLLADDRWYYSMDKGYQGRPLLDPDGNVGRLAQVFTAHRFSPEVVAMRIQRSFADAHASLALAGEHLEQCTPAAAYGAFLKAVQWYQIALMESWGERDNSFGRFGTQFEQHAAARMDQEQVHTLHRLTNLDDVQTTARMAIAPAWVRERRDRSWAARFAIGEQVTPLQNDRDVLRVCSIYELRNAHEFPFAPWLAVPTFDTLRQRFLAMQSLMANAT